MTDNVQISRILDKELINLSLKAKTKDEVIRELTDMLYKANYISDKEGYIQDVYLRESEGVTGIGNNVAIPHVKSDSVYRASVAIGRTEQTIDWESYDDKPVNLFFLFAIPSGIEGAKVHLKLLSQVASKLANDKLLNKLKKAESAEEFIRLLG